MQTQTQLQCIQNRFLAVYKFNPETVGKQKKCTSLQYMYEILDGFDSLSILERRVLFVSS